MFKNIVEKIYLVKFKKSNFDIILEEDDDIKIEGDIQVG